MRVAGNAWPLEVNGRKRCPLLRDLKKHPGGGDNSSCLLLPHLRGSFRLTIYEGFEADPNSLINTLTLSCLFERSLAL